MAALSCYRKSSNLINFNAYVLLQPFFDILGSVELDFCVKGCCLQPVLFSKVKKIVAFLGWPTFLVHTGTAGSSSYLLGY